MSESLQTTLNLIHRSGIPSTNHHQPAMEKPCIFGDNLRQVIFQEAQLSLLKGKKGRLANKAAELLVEMTRLKVYMMSPKNLHYQAALFLDPRFTNQSSKLFRDETRKQKVIDFLVRLNKRIKDLDDEKTTLEEDRELEDRLKRYSVEEKPDPKVDVLQYWKKRCEEGEDSSIEDLVCTVLTVATPRNADSQFWCPCC